MQYHFIIPDLPQSINSLYKINYGHKVVYLSAKGREYKNLVKYSMPYVDFPEDTLFDIKMKFYGNWFYKNGKLKRADVQNLIKILIDAVFEKLGMDDSRIVSLWASKAQSESKRVEVCLEPQSFNVG